MIADLHIHSKYSRATSRDCLPETLELWARRKGIHLLGTGDFTHPAWHQELEEKLTPAEPGFYTLKEGFCLPDDTAGEPIRPRFVLSGEISSIYKKNGRVRKVHNLILLPDLEAAKRLSSKLEAVGNIRSDGRPILGLDSRDLLELTLEASDQAIFIPAHIWTPHFSLFGAFSGFDTIEECFEDLTPYIGALETGLSSDPPMNWQVSALDRYRLVSNSDAHSPAKLGREATLFKIPLHYQALADALSGKDPHGLTGTIEFFPEEGKYHYDGHRACGVCLSPSKAEETAGRCPVCGKKLTIGVQHRVEELADRATPCPGENARPFESLAPLPEVIAGSTGLSPVSVKVQAQYQQLLKQLGNEFYILREAPLEEIGRLAGPCVEEGMRRLRRGEVERIPGYDGEYGIIRLLQADEIQRLSGQLSFFGLQLPEKKKSPKGMQSKHKAKPQKLAETAEELIPLQQNKDPLAGLNKGQRAAVLAKGRAIAVVAGPGTGKTKTLVSRIEQLVRNGEKPGQITAVTFTNKAAAELRGRLTALLGSRAARAVQIGTFHSLCLSLLRELTGSFSLLDEAGAQLMAASVLEEVGEVGSEKSFLEEVSHKKCGSLNDTEQKFSDAAHHLYAKRLEAAGAMDFDDLLLKTLALWQNTQLPAAVQRRFSHLLVDEFQDIDPVQYRLVRAWQGEDKTLFVIGDPDQAIYGFRGSAPRCFERLNEDFEDLTLIRLTENYRSSPEILSCALALISQNPGAPRVLLPHRGSCGKVHTVTAPGELSEAIYVAKQIAKQVGGMDMVEAQGNEEPPRVFSDFAVLYRTHRQAKLLEQCLRQEGIPCLVTGREEYLVQPEVRGFIAFFRFLQSPSDLASLQLSLRQLYHCPAKTVERFLALVSGTSSLTGGLLQSLIAQLPQCAELVRFEQCVLQLLPKLLKTKPFALFSELAKLLEISDSEPIQQLLSAARLQSKLDEFLQDLMLGSEGDLTRGAAKSYSAGAVRLMTLHGSKGLEFPVVFLCGARQGVLPLQLPGTESDEQEERRLFYVGLTRAKDSLFVINPAPSSPSPFLAPFPTEMTLPKSAGPKNDSQGVQLSLF